MGDSHAVASEVEFRVKVRVLALDQDHLNRYIQDRREILERGARATRHNSGILIQKSEVILAQPISSNS